MRYWPNWPVAHPIVSEVCGARADKYELVTTDVMGAVSDLCVVLYYCIHHVSALFQVWTLLVFMKSLRTFVNSTVQIPPVRMMLSVTWRYDLSVSERWRSSDAYCRRGSKETEGKSGCNWALMYNSVHTKVAPLRIRLRFTIAGTGWHTHSTVSNCGATVAIHGRLLPPAEGTLPLSPRT